MLLLYTGTSEDDRKNELKGELDEKKNNLTTSISKIKDTELKNNLHKAATIKENQGIMIAKKIYEDVGYPKNVEDVVWSNTPSKFEYATGSPHEDNPSDIVIKFNKNINIKKYGLNNIKWLGVSLKASFTSGDIGFYNGSICKFVNGILLSNQ